MRTSKRSGAKATSNTRQENGPARELSERLGWTAKQLLSQARPALSLDLAQLAGLLGAGRAR